MKCKFVTALAVAGVLSFAMAGTASAATLGHPKHHKPKPAATAPQVSGVALESALLPAETVGDGYASVYAGNSGSKLTSTAVQYSVPSMNCADFESVVYFTGLGTTAATAEVFFNPNFETGPSIISGDQYVLQFPSTKAASAFYRQALAKYQVCQDFTESDPEDTVPGGGTIDVSASTLAKTTVGPYQAFQVTQLTAESEDSGQTDYNDILTVVAGTNVYQLWENSGTNDEPSTPLMAQLISQVQKLYPRG
jgi:hypothetical protein